MSPWTSSKESPLRLINFVVTWKSYSLDIAISLLKKTTICKIKFYRMLEAFYLLELVIVDMMKTFHLKLNNPVVSVSQVG